MPNYVVQFLDANGADLGATPLQGLDALSEDEAKAQFPTVIVEFLKEVRKLLDTGMAPFRESEFKKLMDSAAITLHIQRADGFGDEISRLQINFQDIVDEPSTDQSNTGPSSAGPSSAT